MAKASASGHKIAESKKYIKDLGEVLSSIRTNLVKLRTDIESIEKGKDGKQAYWSGRAAVNRIKEMKIAYNKYAKEYNEILTKFYTPLYYHFKYANINL